MTSPHSVKAAPQGVSMTWTIENLYFDGRLLALDVLASPSDARYSACNDVLGDYADFTEADDARAEGFIPLGFYCEADIWADSVPETGSVLGSGERKGSEAMRPIPLDAPIRRSRASPLDSSELRHHGNARTVDEPRNLCFRYSQTRRSNRHTGFGQRRTGENQPHPRNSTHAN